MKKNKKAIWFLMMFLLAILLAGCKKKAPADNTVFERPIAGFHEFWDIFVYPMAAIMWLIGNTIGFHNYPVTIVIATIAVRTLAWPIYAKSSDMQLKMELAKPEMDELQKKYEGKEDQESKQRMSLEMMQLYKKYGIGLSGCLLPFIQMPIFIGFYRTIARIPFSVIKEGNWIGKVFKGGTSIFGVNMLLARNQELVTDGAGNYIIQKAEKILSSQQTGIIILCVLVAVTQILSIILNNVHQKKQKAKQYANIPEYRRPVQSEQEKTTQTMMQVMLYVMCFMMVLFVWNSAAGLGLYWVVGNIYTTIQTWLGQKGQGKKLEKLRLKHAQSQKRGAR